MYRLTIIVAAIVVISLVAVDVSTNLVSPKPSGVPLELRRGGSWSLPAAAAPVSPVTVFRKHDAERFRQWFELIGPENPEFATLVENGMIVKQLVWNEAAALKALYDFASSRTDDRSTWDARGYHFRYTSAGDAWSVVAEPLTQYRTGVRSFYVDETGVFRVSLTAPATSSSSAVGDHENWTCRAELVKRVVRLAPL